MCLLSYHWYIYYLKDYMQKWKVEFTQANLAFNGQCIDQY